LIRSPLSSSTYGLNSLSRQSGNFPERIRKQKTDNSGPKSTELRKVGSKPDGLSVLLQNESPTSRFGSVDPCLRLALNDDRSFRTERGSTALGSSFVAPMKRISREMPFASASLNA